MSETSQPQTPKKPASRLLPELAPGLNPSSDYLYSLLEPFRPIIGFSLFLFFALESIVAWLSAQLYGDADPLLKLMFAQLLAVNATLGGLLHFHAPLYDFYTSMIFVPFKKFWLYATGWMLIAGGLMVAFTKTQTIGAQLLVFTFILIFPGNLACVFSRHARNKVCAGSLGGAILRLPFQFLFIAWAWWLTKPTTPLPSL